MKHGKSSWTAEITAIYRAVESLRPEATRLIYDPYAGLFLRRPFRLLLRIPPLARLVFWLAVERRFPGNFDTIVARIRCVDDALRRALALGIQQVVILGAGYDARAYRFREEMQGATVFEVDHPRTQKAKKERAAEIFGRLPANVVYVPIDFERGSLQQVLPRHGYRAAEQTFFVWEGVTKYLTHEAVDAVLGWIAGHSAAGSRVVFDYLPACMLDGSNKEQLIDRILAYQRNKGEPYLFGVAPEALAPWLNRLGFSVVERISMTDLKGRYLQPLDRGRRSHYFHEIAEAVV